MIDDQLKKKARKKQTKQWWSLWLLNFFAFKKSLLDALDQDYFYLCLLKITEPIHGRIFERIKHLIVIVLSLEYTLLSYLNVSSVIPPGKYHFYPANRFWENRKSLFKAEPHSDFNRCYEQQISENHNRIPFIAVS